MRASGGRETRVSVEGLGPTHSGPLARGVAALGVSRTPGPEILRRLSSFTLAQVSAGHQKSDFVNENGRGATR